MSSPIIHVKKNSSIPSTCIVVIKTKQTRKDKLHSYSSFLIRMVFNAQFTTCLLAKLVQVLCWTDKFERQALIPILLTARQDGDAWIFSLYQNTGSLISTNDRDLTIAVETWACGLRYNRRSLFQRDPAEMEVYNASWSHHCKLFESFRFILFSFLRYVLASESSFPRYIFVILCIMITPSQFLAHTHL